MVSDKKLTYSEFCQKHKTKFSRDHLTKDQKRKRYDDYLNTYSNSVVRHPDSKRTSPSSLSKRPTNNGLSKSAIRSKQTEAIKSYLKSVFNPFSPNSAVRMPAVADGLTPSNVVHHREFERIGSIAFTLGRGLAVILRPDLSRFSSWNEVTGNNIVFRHANWYGMKQESALQDKYSSFKVVSMGMRVKYTGPPVDAAGIIGATLIPPGNSLLPMSFQDLSTLPYTKIGPAIDGIEVVAVPFSDSQPFRRTKMSPNLITGSTTPADCWDSGTSSNPSNGSNEILFDMVAQYLSTTVNAGNQQQIDDIAQNSCMPWLLVFGYDLAASATFEVEMVANLELQLRSDANVPGRGFYNSSAPVFNQSEISQALSLSKHVVDQVGPVSTPSEPGVSSIINRNTATQVFNTIKDAASVGATVYNALDMAAIASTAAEWSMPALESAAPVVAGLLL